MLLAQEPEVHQLGDPGLAAGGRHGAGLEHHDAHAPGPGPESAVGAVEPVKLTYADIEKAIGADCSEDSDKWLSIGIKRWASAANLDDFFLRPADPEKFKP